MTDVRKESRLFPGGSKSRVNKAGDNVRANIATADDLEVIEEWRAAHRAVLNTFQAILHGRARGTKIIVAQRHKRKNTVFDKLIRERKMSLSRMDDVAGCRLIFEDIKTLTNFREKFHKARFKHRRKNDSDKYDYISHPKRTGYRGIHDVYEYDVNSEVGRRLAGLYVEIQYRTRVQHSWSTANEVIGQNTDNQPKFGRGDEKIQRAMLLASEILARAHEKIMGALPDIPDRELVEQFVKLDDEIKLIEMLRALNTSALPTASFKNTILMFKDGSPLEVKAFEYATDAIRELFNLENQFPSHDIVLVKAETSDDVRVAFKNYFSDARDFISLVETGCAKLAKTKSIKDVYFRMNEDIAKLKESSKKTGKGKSKGKGPGRNNRWWER